MGPSCFCPSASWSFISVDKPLSAFFVDLLGQVILIAHLFHFMELRLEPIDVLLLVDSDVLQKLTGRIVAYFQTGLDSRLEDRQRRLLERQVVLQLLLH